MTGRVEVGASGAAEIQALARDLKRVGAKDMEKRLYAALNRTTRPAIEDARRSAAATLPSGGGKAKRKSRLVRTGTKTIDGTTYVTRRRVRSASTTENESLADRVAKARYATRPSRGRGGPGVRITATTGRGGKVDLETLDGGTVRHPLFGRRRSKSGKAVWFNQSVQPGWFSRPMQANADRVRRELEKVVDEIDREIRG